MTQSTSTQRFQARQMLADGCPQTHVARTLGVSRQTISNWLSDPDFMAGAVPVESIQNGNIARLIRHYRVSVEDALEDLSIARHVDKVLAQEALDIALKSAHGYKLIANEVISGDRSRTTPAFLNALGSNFKMGADTATTYYHRIAGTDELIEGLYRIHAPKADDIIEGLALSPQPIDIATPDSAPAPKSTETADDSV